MRRWEIWIAAIALAFANWNLDKHGVAFEKKFNSYNGRKRGTLYITATLLVLAIGIFSYFTLRIGRAAHLSGAIR